MICFKHSALLVALLVSTLLPHETEGGAMVISDDRVRSLDIAPVLGRGYSIGTNSFQSTCLIVDETTTPSYNYDYKFTDHSSASKSDSTYERENTRSFSYAKIQQKTTSKYKGTNKSSADKKVMSATMKIMRYYSSVREELSPLTEDALTLLDQQDYIGFFKSCGPNYVRSLRRAQELTAIFEFTSSSQDRSSSLARTLTQTGGSTVTAIDVDSTVSNKFKSETDNMMITIVGYGLGLNQEGSSTLVATSLEEYTDVLNFAFKSFTTGEDSHNIGMVYGMEIVPWVDNTAFQVAARVLDEEVEVRLPRSLIPKAICKSRDRAVCSRDGTDGTGTVAAPATVNADIMFDNDATNVQRALYKCKEPAFHMDMYGYCCEDAALFNLANQTYQREEQEVLESVRVCNPVRRLDKSVVKNNMSNNGEFVAHLDSLIRYRLNQLFTLEKCLTQINTFSDFYKYHIVKAQDSVKYDATIEHRITVRELQLMMDPGRNYGSIRQLGREMDEFVEMYYQPCIAALFGTNVGNNPSTEPQYFMAYGWLTHDECGHLSCLADNMRWNRVEGGCEPSGIIAPRHDFVETVAYNPALPEDPFCAKAIDDDNDDSGAEVPCKHTSKQIYDFAKSSGTCWKSSAATPAYLMSHFCMPSLSGEIATAEHQAVVNARSTTCGYTEATYP